MENYLYMFYALPLPKVVLFMLILFAVWTSVGILFYSNSSLERKWKIINMASFVLSILLIIQMTILGRASEVIEVEWRPFYTFTTVTYNNEAYRTMLMNVVLFLPLGLTLPYALSLWKNVKRVACISIIFGAVLSLCIELIQLFFRMGRAETDDIICNTFGCVLGVCSYLIVEKYRRKSAY